VAELGMMVARAWRGRGVGSALLAAGIDWARHAGAHRLAYRRRNGELWAALAMGLPLDPAG
jgi:GNAT superfamily N-acetyltransferase